MKRREALMALGSVALIGPHLFCTKERSNPMKKEIKTNKAPQAIGPYSQAIEANGFVFVSGQIALDPSTGKLIQGGIKEQTQQALANVKAILEESGSSLEKVAKCTVFLKDLNDYGSMNEVYGKFFSAPYPARAAVQVARLPKDVKVEIEAMATK